MRSGIYSQEAMRMTRESPNWIGDPAHARWLADHLDELLRFGAQSATSTGFGHLGSDGELIETQPAERSELYITCRMIHSFSLGAMLGRPGCGSLADHGLASLQTTFHDAVNDGWFASVDAEGPRDRDKQAYAHAFVLLATASATVAGRPGAASLLEEAMEVHLLHFWSDDETMVLEGWDETWTECEQYRGVNANMHTVEAYLAVADTTGDAAWRYRALLILKRVFNYAAAREWLIPEHFSATWEPLPDYNDDDRAHPFRPYGATIGHSFEWARLGLHARAGAMAAGVPAADVEWLLDGARALFDTAVGAGWAVDGKEGFVYTVDFDGVPVVRERMHWVLAEAIAAAAALWLATTDQKYADWYSMWWDHAATYFLDGTGSWVHELDSSNRPASTVWQGKPDIYHAVQAALIPRLPLSPTIATAVREGLIDT